jgi:carboxyl-terminal processing protease
MKKLIQFMKRNYKIILPILFLAGALLSFNHIKKHDPDTDKALVQVLRLILTQGHYQPVAIDDAFSEGVYTNYLETIDPTKHYFLQSDIDEFNRYKDSIDDQVLHDDLSFFYVVYDRYLQRLEETETICKDILDNPIDITKKETYSVDYENAKFPKDKKELRQVWQKQLKMRYLGQLYDKELAEKDKVKMDSTYQAKTLETLKKEALEKTKENMDKLYERLYELDQEDWFTYYINSITAQFGPHTSYLSPKNKKRFDISMAGKLEGIGARLMKEGEYTKVTELISGGPAWRAGELEVGDLILKVAQGDAEPLDIVGMRLDDAIEFIKGKKGTEVRLTLKKVDGTIQTISIIRDVVELEETFVKSAIVEKEGKKYGVIYLPKFYIDFDHRNARNSASDMALELERLKKEGVSGIMIDLRDNGGGSLKTAIDIAGLFIDEGPVVQVKYRGEKANVREDDEPGAQWSGPMVVLVNELSASASEIFAAAMQDYKRAVIIGGKQTFGKGTVQNFYPLNQYANTNKDLGFLKMTIQKFYRINGGSTQLRGVTPNVVVPTRYSYLDIGERDYDNAMPWDRIKPVHYKTWDAYTNFDLAIQNSIQRISDNPQFKLIDSNAEWLKKAQEDKTVYLDYEAFKQDIVLHDEAAKKFEAIDDYNNDLQFTSPKYEIPLMEADSVLAQKRERWHSDLSKDIYIDESINILEDLRVKLDEELVKH